MSEENKFTAISSVGAGLLAIQSTRLFRRIALSFIVSKPAPTGFVCWKHEAFVMKLKALRPNVAYYAGCSTFTELARVRYQTQSFT
ncbi:MULTISPECIES: hypothetical protein [unclassified Pseudomonas]|uniref:hypothetical protein n=1 Tax=unclassified Pseudomonas TaxID=196821 RepID=UPI001CBE6921|nr:MULTISPECIES: hypothetical protein [unclassified Pseudomonas]